VRAAPPVSVQGTGGLPWRMLRAGLPALAAGALAAWGLGHAGMPAAPALAVVGAVAGIAGWRLRPRPALVAWDGQRWAVDGVTGTLAVMIDVGAGLLLRLQPDAPRRPPRWVAVGTREAGAAMHALRAAAYARVPAPAHASGADALPQRR
jgi:hypothetical protein